MMVSHGRVRTALFPLQVVGLDKHYRRLDKLLLLSLALSPSVDALVPPALDLRSAYLFVARPALPPDAQLAKGKGRRGSGLGLSV